jgi:hypothetical protein
MNEQSVEYLIENIKYLGFGEKLNKELEKNILAGLPEFQLLTEAGYSGQKMQAVLYFTKSERSEMYFFNKYSAWLIKDDMLDQDRRQIFYIHHGHGVTLKEAFNLLEGRAVNKDLFTARGERFNAWLQLDFGLKDKNGNYELKYYHQNYGFDIEKVLEEYPIRELGDPDDRKIMINSLKKGNLYLVFFEEFAGFEKMWIEANPKLRKLNLYDFEKNPLSGRSADSNKPSVDLEEKPEEMKEQTKGEKEKETMGRMKDEKKPKSRNQKKARR